MKMTVALVKLANGYKAVVVDDGGYNMQGKGLGLTPAQALTSLRIDLRNGYDVEEVIEFTVLQEVPQDIIKILDKAENYVKTAVGELWTAPDSSTLVAYICTLRNYLNR